MAHAILRVVGMPDLHEPEGKLTSMELLPAKEMPEATWLGVTVPEAASDGLPGA